MHAEKNIWYPFGQQKTSRDPIFITHGKGSKLYDADGKSYIDAISSWWTNIHGHAHPYIADAVNRQFHTLEHVIFSGFTHAPAEQLAEKLLEHLPTFSKVFFSDNGSTAVEVALKMALQFWKNSGKDKQGIIALDGAYHGDTFGSMSVSERDAFTAPFHALLFDSIYLPFPGSHPDAAIEQMRRACASGNIAAFIYEPLVQGAAGMQMYPPEILDQLIRIAKEHDVLCIADEVMTGFYRTGSLFASDQCKEKPDIICLSKGITGGSMPLSVTLCTQEIYDAFYSDEKGKAFWHGHSYTGHPLACAAALASLELLMLPSTQEAIQRIVKRHHAAEALLASSGKFENVRQCGTILAVDIPVKDPGYFSNIRDDIYYSALEKGVLLRPLGNAAYVLPPYCISDEELDVVYNTLFEL
ncbi:MAG: adenosylmethionine-8-amino-7-oxononanoate aminotransferase [Sphingobacteriales bacterium BACL12 MAG-120813-bin55]|nr:MAG: adenosylmethionine-8-amino-7-oxononanoate aminotransferase [Sphingobacteriales bacterium BACL12 MAG-120813-bin55]